MKPVTDWTRLLCFLSFAVIAVIYEYSSFLSSRKLFPDDSILRNFRLMEKQTRKDTVILPVIVVIVENSAKLKHQSAPYNGDFGL